MTRAEGIGDGCGCNYCEIDVGNQNKQILVICGVGGDKGPFINSVVRGRDSWNIFVCIGGSKLFLPPSKCFFF